MDSIGAETLVRFAEWPTYFAYHLTKFDKYSQNMHINPDVDSVGPFISLSKLWKMAEGVQHSRRRCRCCCRQLQFIKLYKPNENSVSLSTERYKYSFFYSDFQIRKCDAITHSMEMYLCSLALVPAARAHTILKWRDGNSMSSPITATFTFTVIICYCLVCWFSSSSSSSASPMWCWFYVCTGHLMY